MMRWGPLSEGPQGGWGGASFSSLAAPAPSQPPPHGSLPPASLGAQLGALVFSGARYLPCGAMRKDIPCAAPSQG